MVDSIAQSTNYSSGLKWTQEEQANGEAGGTGNNNQMSQEDFFSLLTTQLAQQDPTKPTDNDQMIAQMTNFTMAEGISDMQSDFAAFNDNFSAFMGSMESSQTSNKALQASSMVGREVMIESENVGLFQYSEDGGAAAKYQLLTDNTMSDVKLKIFDEAGKEVNHLDLGIVKGDSEALFWDGKDPDGNQLPPGLYKFEMTGINANGSGKREDVAVGAYTRISSVSFGAGNELGMNLAGMGSVGMDKILEVAP